ncbi:MAG: hypothetical protein AAFP17_13375 [Pseudomonadota bacterium]
MNRVVIDQQSDARRITAASLAWARSASGRLPFREKALTFLATCLAPAACYLVATVLAPPGQSLGVLIGALAGWAAFWIIACGLRYRNARQLIKAAMPEAPERLQSCVTLDKHGLWTEDAVSRSFIAWAAIDDVIDIDGGLALVYGTQSLPLVEEALPKGVTRPQLRDLINDWRAAA